MNLYVLPLYPLSCIVLFDDMHDFSMIREINFHSSIPICSVLYNTVFRCTDRTPNTVSRINARKRRRACDHTHSLLNLVYELNQLVCCCVGRTSTYQ